MTYTLAPFAAQENNSKGRRFQEEGPGYRSEYQRDRDRIVHCTAFRRLEYKTQVFVNHEGDLFRTRLTHSIEVAQIGRAMARALGLNEDLTEAIALAHDLGHTPFGHAGQEELNRCMEEFGGFEHNLQSLRVVDLLEEKYADFQGLNLTFETREGILKHCSPGKAEALGELGKRFLNRTQPTLEAQLVNLADEIAYNNHDVDDGLRSQFIGIEQLEHVSLFKEQHQLVSAQYPNLNERRAIHEIVRRMINRLVSDLLSTSAANLKRLAPQSIDDVRQHSEPILGFSQEMVAHNLELKQFLRRNLYTHYRVYRMTSKARHIIRRLFEAFMDDFRLLPDHHAEKARQGEREEGMEGKARAIADYIAGMTDRYAIAEYKKLFEAFQLT